jgi:deoxyinosine 3'endonuclease (endonuclease V)
VAPYIPGFLAFRESQPVTEMIQKQMTQNPELTPNYLMIDGNGMLHCRKFGLACHIGVILDIPTLGLTKNFYSLENSSNSPKVTRDEHKKKVRNELKKAGDFFNICHEDGAVAGLALKMTNQSERPCYVSIGHKMSLAKAKNLALRTAVHKIPEPTRQADMIGREYIREHFS